MEDDQSVAGFLRDALVSAGLDVLWCQDLAAARAAVAAAHFDCLILDRMLPSGDSLDWVAQWAQAERPPILFLTALDALDEKLAGLALGDDYLVKPFAVDELLARVQALLRRRGAGDSVLEGGGITLNRLQRTVRRGDQVIALNPMEFKLLEYLLLQKHQPVSRQMLLEHVWEYSFEPATSIVETYISRLRSKLEVPDLPPAIVTVRGSGYAIAEL